MLVAILCWAAGPLAAQERISGQSQDTQLNWSSLRNQLGLINQQNQAIAATIGAINAKLAAIAQCGKAQKMWDGTNCVDVAIVNNNTTVINTTTNSGSTRCGSMQVVQTISNGAITVRSIEACRGVTLTGNAGGVTNCPDGGYSVGGLVVTPTPTKTVCGYDLSCSTNSGPQCASYSCHQIIDTSQPVTTRTYSYSCMVPN